MDEWIETIDGTPLEIRPIGVGDHQRLADHFGRLSASTRFKRFLGSVERLSARQLQRFTDVDHHGHEALVAVSEGGEIEGVARYIAVPGQASAAEVAVTIADEWQGRGVGSALLGRLMERARAEGISTFTASCFATNREMLSLFRELGQDVEVLDRSQGVVELEIELPTTPRVRPASITPPG